MNDPITVTNVVNVPVEHAWKCWTEPSDIVQWAFADDTWEAPKAENDVRVGGRFSTLMAAKDKSAEFDFNGEYMEVEALKLIAYTMEDGRKVRVEFEADGDKTKITEIFEPESINSRELQFDGWQAILDNFKKHAENTK
jgi:uncharacterized protein YndB with AHSA1/START domain